MQNCPVWKEFYCENTKPNLMMMGVLLYGLWKSGEWKLILLSSFVFAGENYYEPLIDEAHVATAHGGVEKTLQYVTDRYHSQSASALVQSFVASCDTCQRRKQSNKLLLGLVTPQHVPVRPWTDISRDFLKLTSLFIKCSTMYLKIEINHIHMLCILRIQTIVDRHSGYTFLITIPDNFKAEQSAHTHEGHLLPYIAYTNTILFDRDSVFKSDHFQAWAPTK